MTQTVIVDVDESRRASCGDEKEETGKIEKADEEEGGNLPLTTYHSPPLGPLPEPLPLVSSVDCGGAENGSKTRLRLVFQCLSLVASALLDGLYIFTYTTLGRD
ncbi:hypothetical protein H6P81_008937 [Aristolochia fimbriata]|uniref:Solute carrier family 40 protein n=1 Tax=Aristolochia fimbriata TaxID=158543 RepID=A0AAV7EJE6_ARIFI|nr:hypothetical protein H6P81_008937 [Aristolochia fimbriata]